ncbi:MAG: hypothetical protein IJP14_05605, partial [Clostridia bacterium]|nr:hypothetical protein [Clostridia bacterium]
FRYATQKVYADFETATHNVNGTDYAGATISVTEAGSKATDSEAAVTGFNTQNMMLYYELASAVDLTEDWDNAHVSFYIRFNGEISGKTTGKAPKLQVKLLTGDPISYNKGRFVNYTFATGESWQKVDLTLAQLTAGHNLTTEIIKENATAFEFVVVNASTNTNAIAATGDSIEIADLKLYKTVEAPTTPAGIDLKFSEVSLSLSDNLTMNFKANKALFDSKYTNPYAMINGNKIAGVLDEENGVYVFSYDNIAPQSMADSITATLFATYNGSLCEGKTVESSVKTYCEWLLANATSDAQRRLVVDLYNYGSAAQAYVNKRPNRLINSYLSTTQAAWGTAEMANIANKTVNEDNGSAVTWSQAGLVLDDSVRVWFEFAAADTTGLTVKITDTTGKELDVIEAAAFAEQSAGVYRVSFDGLNAKGMRRLLNVTVYDAQGNAVSNTLTYSVESYIYTVLNGGSDNAKLQALVTALMNYGDAAIAYAAV